MIEKTVTLYGNPVVLRFSIPGNTDFTNPKGGRNEEPHSS